MTIKPIASKRTVVLTVQTYNNDQPQPRHPRSANAGTIVTIGAVVNNGLEVMKYSFGNDSEIDLLREFWHVVRPMMCLSDMASGRL